jgi:hypothetical protein
MMMDTRIEKEVRLLKAYAVVSTLIFIVLAFAAFQKSNQKTKFEELDVERLNIIEKDGKLKVVLANEAKAPPVIFKGKTLSKGSRSPGIYFYNANGEECGGVAYGTNEKDGKYEAHSGILFDQYNQDQTVGITYSDSNGNRAAGLNVWDRPDTPIWVSVEKLDAIRAMQDGEEKTAALNRLRESGELGASRVFVGKGRDKAAVVMLADSKGKPRIKMTVDGAGVAKLEFMDETGKVTYSLPESAKK